MADFPATQEQEQEETAVLTASEHHIILHNDDVNTFDHVISCLVRICDQTAEQAEQCAYIVHYNGKCEVKTGSLEDLKPRCLRLLDEGLSAELV
ncbi:ATP-dependent Clp protease adaptor ClpS [Flavobacteriaceae bacterium]|jgi:ATP-dependent Clp protease adaptor protein ClpS|nr:ATP-dependent Clp protease adaptor ClpS [Flavobacteriaceae bacterium]MDA9330599.1 ATP-dependent Clp protease adaptor ClpS [Flavobacteriaceae bacterium]MDA9984452.1 ATP-dependent Clp protease adaptor ClpS [Flavobacteriaceae bacterium]MDB9821395.1 ATP-dependent Clp protease adaptor ClpS [Flavobacteriaceae bacterium]